MCSLDYTYMFILSTYRVLGYYLYLHGQAISDQFSC